jgi:hypothetical protein
MKAVSRKGAGAAPASGQPPGTGADKRDESDKAEREVSLHRASLVLRAIRKRYEAGRSAYPRAHRYSVPVAVDASDMDWITAAIKAVEKVIADGSFEFAGDVAQHRRSCGRRLRS